jgi:hypothetical protein
VARFRVESHVAAVLKRRPPQAPLRRSTAEAAARMRKSKAPVPPPLPTGLVLVPHAQNRTLAGRRPWARLVRAALIATLALGVLFGAIALNKGRQRPPAQPACAATLTR